VRVLSRATLITVCPIDLSIFPASLFCAKRWLFDEREQDDLFALGKVLQAVNQKSTVISILNLLVLR
jgi:hypothetical protein